MTSYSIVNIRELGRVPNTNVFTLYISNTWSVHTYHMQVHLSGKLHPRGDVTSKKIQAHLPRQPPFSQHILWRCCNPPGIQSSMTEILLFNSVFHDGVNPVSVSTLKLPLGVIGVFTTETPSISYIISLYIRLVVTL